MKVKARLRRFWRHNKKMGGMWAMLLQVLVILIPPYHFHDIIFVLIGLIWLVVWKNERHIDTMHRVIGIISRKYFRDMFDHHNNMIGLLEEKQKMADDLIKCNEEKIEMMQQLIALKQQTEKSD